MIASCASRPARGIGKYPRWPATAPPVESRRRPPWGDRGSWPRRPRSAGRTGRRARPRRARTSRSAAVVGRPSRRDRSPRGPRWPIGRLPATTFRPMAVAVACGVTVRSKPRSVRCASPSSISPTASMSSRSPSGATEATRDVDRRGRLESQRGRLGRDDHGGDDDRRGEVAAGEPRAARGGRLESPVLARPHRAGRSHPATRTASRSRSGACALSVEPGRDRDERHHIDQHDSAAGLAWPSRSSATIDSGRWPGLCSVSSTAASRDVVVDALPGRAIVRRARDGVPRHADLSGVTGP